MIDIALSQEEPWPDGRWEQLATAAVRGAIGATPFGTLLTTPATVEVSIRLTSDGRSMRSTTSIAARTSRPTSCPFRWYSLT